MGYIIELTIKKAPEFMDAETFYEDTYEEVVSQLQSGIELESGVSFFTTFEKAAKAYNYAHEYIDRYDDAEPNEDDDDFC